MNLLNPMHSMSSLAEFLRPFPLFAQSVGEAAVQEVDSVPSEDLSAWTSTWTMAMVIPIVLGAVGYVLLQHGIVKSRAAIFGGAMALAFSLCMTVGFIPWTLDSAILMVFCAVATAGGVGFLVAREPVYSALGFATAVLSVCGVLFMQSALFVAAATMIVYAGATIIIFLFVLMFAQQTELSNYDIQLNKPVVAATIGAILLATITICVTSVNAMSPVRVDATRALSSADLPDNLSTEAGKAAAQKLDAIDPSLRFVPKSTAGLGRSMYTDYLIAVELAGTVLLVATIGAIALAQRTTENAS